MTSVYAQSAEGDVFSDQMLALTARQNIDRARQHRRRHEANWKQNLAIAAGQHWLEVDRTTRMLVMPNELHDKELYTADRITEYRTHVLGELATEDDRPELLLARDDGPSEDYQRQLNRAVRFAWDHEACVDEALEEARRLCVDLGTSAIRCRWDRNAGPMLPDPVPFVNGKPVLDPQAQYALFEQGPNPDVQIGQMRQGAIRLDPCSAFNILVPPGVPHEKDFPWECIVRPTLLDDVRAEYGDVVADITEDADIGSLLGETLAGPGGSSLELGHTGGDVGRLREHVWLFTYFERPTQEWPQGRTLTLVGNQMKLARVEPSLPYQGPNGDWRSGIAYFHWWRVSGRFWSRSLVEAMKDPQRGINKRRTQINEIIDRGMPFWFVEQDSKVMKRTGVPGEFIELRKDEMQPINSPGIPPGAWLQADVEALGDDLERATGVRAARLGENPESVTTYSQLALINENDQTKREVIITGQRRAIVHIVEDIVYDIRTYWGPNRHVPLAGDDEQIEVEVFNATQIPPFFIVETAKGAAKPRSQAARLQMVADIWRAVVESGAVMIDPHAWVAWFAESMQAGDVAEIPQAHTDEHVEKAALENRMMFEGGQPPVAYYDRIDLEVPVHRQAQNQALLTGDIALYQRIEHHVQTHLAVAEANIAQVQATLPDRPPDDQPADSQAA